MSSTGSWPAPCLMLDIVLVQPEIPPNTGNVIRLAANTGARLHLVRPLGFSLDDKQLKRAGLDYHEYASVAVHDSWTALTETLRGRRMFAFATSGQRLFTDVRYARDDVLVFGQDAASLAASRAECTPSATWPRLATTSLSERPRASSRPTRRLRDRSPVAVRMRSPAPARPMNVSGCPPSAVPSRAISARPRVISAARAFSPSPRPSEMPAAIAITFFTAPPIPTPMRSEL